MTTTQEQREQFEYWLANMDHFLEEFSASIPKDLASQLDYSPDSLVSLETFIIQQYVTVEAIRAKSEGKMLNGLSIYLGETFRKGLGGKWSIELEDESDSEYGVPALEGFGDDEPPLAPIYLVTACVDRRKGNYLISIYNANLPS